MDISVGILYSSQAFLKYVYERRINVEEFSVLFNRFNLTNPKYILRVSLDCKWINLTDNGIIEVTDIGKEVILNGDYQNQLRIQLIHLIEVYKPSWSALIYYGRLEAIKFFPTDIIQCFKEAGLLDGYEQNVIEWWDKLAASVRGLHEDENLRIGRIGERLSFEYEKIRTCKIPKWQSVDSNLSGYDILSYESSSSHKQLKIEVKASNSLNDIQFYITRREWNVAINSSDYVFHIWSLNPINELHVVSVEDMNKNIPLDLGKGNWESVKIRFSKKDISDKKIIM